MGPLTCLNKPNGILNRVISVLNYPTSNLIFTSCFCTRCSDFYNFKSHYDLELTKVAHANAAHQRLVMQGHHQGKVVEVRQPRDEHVVDRHVQTGIFGDRFDGDVLANRERIFQPSDSQDAEDFVQADRPILHDG